MIDPNHERLSIARQCRLVRINRSTFYYQPQGESPLNLKLMRLIDRQWMRAPHFGTRGMTRHLRRRGYCVGRKRIRRLMRKMGISAVYPKPRLSKPHPEHRNYPYLLRDLSVDRPNQVWCSDITYLPMKRGFMYLVAIMDWYSRRVLSWRVSNTLEADLCVAALEDALGRYGKPEIFNTDQGSQFTSLEFTDVLKHNNIAISMDGKGRWMDNVFIERLWWSLKYECIYLNDFPNGKELKTGVGNWIDFYNFERGHSSLDDRTPNEVYLGSPPSIPGHAQGWTRGMKAA